MRIRTSHGRSQDFFGGEGTLSKNIQIFSKKYFRQFLKIFLRKLLKMQYVSIVFSQFNNAWGQLLRDWTKNAMQEIFEKHSKIFKGFLRKLRKKDYFIRFFT